MKATPAKGQKPNALNDANRWLDGEISLGRFIHNSSLETCYAQASDFAGGIANAFSDKLKTVVKRLDSKIDRAEKDYSEAIDEINKTAEAARKRAIQDAISEIRLELGTFL